MRPRFVPVYIVLVVSAGLWAFPLHASANSDSGCANKPPEACKTVQVDNRSRLTAPSTTGTITFYAASKELTASTKYRVVDAIEFLPAKLMKFAKGSYTLSWGACSDGSAHGATYTVGAGGDYATKTPPRTDDSPTGVTITAGADGGFRCAYTLEYPSGDAIPAGGNGSVRNDFWVFSLSGKFVTHTASKSVAAGGGPPVPEVPSAILIPAGMLLLGGGFLFLRRRQTLAPVS
jgi:hypothetical protein